MRAGSPCPGRVLASGTAWDSIATPAPSAIADRVAAAVTAGSLRSAVHPARRLGAVSSVARVRLAGWVMLASSTPEMANVTAANSSAPDTVNKPTRTPPTAYPTRMVRFWVTWWTFVADTTWSSPTISGIIAERCDMNGTRTRPVANATTIARAVPGNTRQQHQQGGPGELGEQEHGPPGQPSRSAPSTTGPGPGRATGTPRTPAPTATRTRSREHQDRHRQPGSPVPDLGDHLPDPDPPERRVAPHPARRPGGGGGGGAHRCHCAPAPRDVEGPGSPSDARVAGHAPRRPRHPGRVPPVADHQSGRGRPGTRPPSRPPASLGRSGPRPRCAGKREEDKRNETELLTRWVRPRTPAGARG